MTWAEREIERLSSLNRDEWDEDDWLVWSYIEEVNSELDWLDSRFE